MNYVSSIEGQLGLLSLQKTKVNVILFGLGIFFLLFSLAAPIIVNDYLVVALTVSRVNLNLNYSGVDSHSIMLPS